MVNHFEVDSKNFEEVSRRDSNENMDRFIKSYLTLKWMIEVE